MRIAGALALVAALGCAGPEYGDLPARCSDGECPEGYECIRGVCAAAGTPVPTTLQSFGNLRGVDLEVVPEADSALVVWQTYAYSPEGQRIAGARLHPDGSASAELELVSTFVADESAVEPFFDVLRVADDTLLVALSAAPLPDDESSYPRIITYRVSLPSPGNEAQPAQFAAAWDQEERMPTIGYGAVSRPKLVARDGRVELGYFQTRAVPGEMTEPAETLGELAVFRLDESGARTGTCDPACCPADACYRGRRELPVAVGVVDAFARADRTWWVLDDARPSALLVPDADPGLAVDEDLAPLAIPVAASDDALTYLEPSARTGEKLPTDPVTGPSRLVRLTVELPPGGGAGGGAGAGGAGSGGGSPATVTEETIGGDLPGLRDSPRPVWIRREGKPAIVISPGVELASPTIDVLLVDDDGGGATVATRVDRFGSAAIGGLGGALVGGKLYVVWIDGGEDAATVRAAVVPEP